MSVYMAYIFLPKKKDTRRKNKTTDELYKYHNSKEWKRVRKEYISNNPLCEWCLATKDGYLEPAKQVHHLIKLSSGITTDQIWSMLVDEDNLLSVCTCCHYYLDHEGYTDSKNLYYKNKAENKAE